MSTQESQIRKVHTVKCNKAISKHILVTSQGYATTTLLEGFVSMKIEYNAEDVGCCGVTVYHMSWYDRRPCPSSPLLAGWASLRARLAVKRREEKQQRIRLIIGK